MSLTKILTETLRSCSPNGRARGAAEKYHFVQPPSPLVSRETTFHRVVASPPRSALCPARLRSEVHKGAGGCHAGVECPCLGDICRLRGRVPRHNCVDIAHRGSGAWQSQVYRPRPATRPAVSHAGFCFQAASTFGAFVLGLAGMVGIGLGAWRWSARFADHDGQSARTVVTSGSGRHTSGISWARRATVAPRSPGTASRG